MTIFDKGEHEMKKLAAVLLTVAMTLSLAACGGSDGRNGTGYSDTARGSYSSSGGYSAVDEEEKGSGGAAPREESDDRAWLPDPCTALNVSGEYVETDIGDSGESYDMYTYDFSADYETVAHFIVTYTEALKAMGYTSKKLKQTGNSVWYQQYTYGSNTGAELGVFVSSGAEEITGGGVGEWRVVYAVPECYCFIPGNGAPGVSGGNTICVGCHGSGRCAGCGGLGSANYGDGYETCVICDGNGICNICDGEGSY